MKEKATRYIHMRATPSFLDKIDALSYKLRLDRSKTIAVCIDAFVDGPNLRQIWKMYKGRRFMVLYDNAYIRFQDGEEPNEHLMRRTVKSMSFRHITDYGDGSETLWLLVEV